MFKIFHLLLSLLAAILVLQCSNNPTATNNGAERELTAAEKHLVQSDNKFGLRLFGQIITEEKEENIFISPLSVSMALGMTYNGADGETQKAMQRTLELQGLSLKEVSESYKSLIELLSQLDPKVQFQIANSIWYRQGLAFEKEFIELNKTYFDALVTGLNFDNSDAAATINGWVDENTNGKIKQIVKPPINPDMVMFLINAIYFKGLWTYQFDKEKTTDEKFFLPDGSSRTCKMMIQEGEFDYFEDSDFQVISLPYGDGDFSMIVFLPRMERNVDSLIAQLNEDNWEKWIGSFSEKEGTIQLPRFTLEYELKLNDALKTLGMAIAFDPFQADFTKLYQGPQNAYISEVKHKSFVEVNEEGTEAAAVTSVGIAVTSVDPEIFWMRVDRPFVFAIRENHSQTILFIGKIIEPSSGQ
jgi:serine protease inhibitor